MIFISILHYPSRGLRAGGLRLKPRYEKCTEKEKIKMIVLKRMYKKNEKKVKNKFVELEHLMVM